MQRISTATASFLATIFLGITTAALADQADEAAASVNKLGLDLFSSVYEQGENQLLAPYSISSALAMTLAGAAGETRQEMLSALRFSQGEARVHTGFGQLSPYLRAEKERDGYQLDIANRLFGQSGFSFKQEFLKTTADYYGASLEALDFVGAPEEARLTINGWVEDQTSERIKNLLPQGAITPATRLTLVNAVYFNGDWVHKFDEDDTVDGEFTVAEGSKAPVRYMNMQQDFRILKADDDNVSVIELPYATTDAAESSTSMIVFLPGKDQGAEAISTLIQNADETERLISELYAQQPRLVRLKLPKWKVAGATINLKPELIRLGMTAAFSPYGADFTRIADVAPENLFIEGVFHKTFISVTEGGTEAAGATAVTVGVTSVPMAVEFSADRPFFYLIRDNKTGVVLFAGTLVKPEV